MVQTFSGSDSRRCTSCNGRGKCSTCGGSSKSKKPCVHCNGTGRILSRSKIKTAYLAALGVDTPPTGTDNAVAKPYPPPAIDTSGMDPVFSKRLQYYLSAYRRNQLDSVIFDAQGDLDEHDAARRGWQKYARQTKQFILTAKAETRRQAEATQAKAEADAAAARRAANEREASQQERETVIKEFWKTFLKECESYKRESISFRKATFDAEKHKGKILVSKVQIVLVNPHAVLVHPLGLAEDQVLTCSPSVFQKALRAWRIQGDHGVVTIEYVIVEPIKGLDPAVPGMPCMRLIGIDID